MENKKEIMKISKEEFDFRIKCVELCLKDIKNNDKPLRSLFDINIATDLDDKECLDWYEEKIVIWVDGLEKFYEVSKKEWLKNRDVLVFPQNEKGWGYSEHEYASNKDWIWKGKNEMKKLKEDLINYDRTHPNSSTTFDNSTIDNY
jgi:hypothetical protein